MWSLCNRRGEKKKCENEERKMEGQGGCVCVYGVCVRLLQSLTSVFSAVIKMDESVYCSWLWACAHRYRCIYLSIWMSGWCEHFGVSFFFFFFKSEKKHNIHCKGRIFLNLCQSYLLYMSVNIQSRKCNSCIAGTGVCRYLRRPNKLFLFQNHIQILGWDSDVSDDKLREKLKNN